MRNTYRVPGTKILWPQRLKTDSTALLKLIPSGEERNYNPVGYELCNQPGDYRRLPKRGDSQAESGKTSRMKSDGEGRKCLSGRKTTHAKT